MTGALSAAALLALALTGSIQPSTVRLRGHVVLGHEVRSFEPCGQDEQLWVVPTRELVSAYEELSHEPYAPVFVELRAERRPAPDAGFGAEYEEQLRVLTLMRAAPATEGHGCAEDLSEFVFRAAGNEPFWSLRVTRDSIALSTPEVPSREFPGVSSNRGSRASAFEAEGISLNVEPGSCSDTMVGARYSWRARVDVDGKRYHGCAWEGDVENVRGLVGVTWRLVSIESPEGGSSEPDGSAVPTLTFTDEETDGDAKRIHGFGGCNRFFGSYIAREDGSLSIPSPIAATRMACPEPTMSLEIALLQMLEGAGFYELDAGRLTITCERGTLRFVAAADEN